MTKIKNIEDVKNYNILCTSPEQVRNVLEKLQELGFNITYCNDNGMKKIIYNNYYFQNTWYIDNHKKSITYNDFKKFIKILKKSENKVGDDFKKTGKTEKEYLTTHDELVKNVGRKVSCYIKGKFLKEGSIYIIIKEEVYIYITYDGIKLDGFDSICCSTTKEKYEFDKLFSNSVVSKIKLLPQEDDIYIFDTDLLKIEINKTSPEKSKILKKESKYQNELFQYEEYTDIEKFIKDINSLKSRGEFDKIPDIEVASDGRIKNIDIQSLYRNDKINEYFYTVDGTKHTFYKIIKYFGEKLLLDSIKAGIIFNTSEARDKTVEKMKVETELKNIADELNGGIKIDWEEYTQWKYSIIYNYDCEILDYNSEYCRRTQGTIYCLSNKFLKVAIDRIGEDRLTKYFKN